jgi:hypothetical protein
MINPLKDLVPEIIWAASELDRSVLPIQGPPGTGKPSPLRGALREC